jgi:ribosomal protein S18 acetylase RimI-like enzyme
MTRRPRTASASPPAAPPGRELVFRIRSGHLADHLALCRLWGQVDAFHATIRPDFFVGSTEPSRSRLYLDRIVDDANQELLVAVEGDALLGLIHLQLYDTPRSPVFALRRRAHVEDLVVDRAARRRGVGTALLRAGEDWARRNHAEQLVLTVWRGNEAAEAFYARFGYGSVSQVLAKEL